MRIREWVGQTHQPIATLPRDGGERGLDLGGAAHRDLGQLRHEGRSGGLDRAQELPAFVRKPSPRVGTRGGLFCVLLRHSRGHFGRGGHSPIDRLSDRQGP
jgi:hypothetical protein